MTTHAVPEDEEEDLAAVFAGLEATPLPGKPAARRSCPGCDTVYDGAACPSCGLRYRPRCTDCGARLAWAKDAHACPACGLPTPRRLFFEDPPPAPPRPA